MATTPVSTSSDLANQPYLPGAQNNPTGAQTPQTQVGGTTMQLPANYAGGFNTVYASDGTPQKQTTIAGVTYNVAPGGALTPLATQGGASTAPVNTTPTSTIQTQANAAQNDANAGDAAAKLNPLYGMTQAQINANYPNGVPSNVQANTGVAPTKTPPQQTPAQAAATSTANSNLNAANTATTAANNLGTSQQTYTQDQVNQMVAQQVAQQTQGFTAATQQNSQIQAFNASNTLSAATENSFNTTAQAAAVQQAAQANTPQPLNTGVQNQLGTITQQAQTGMLPPSMLNSQTQAVVASAPVQPLPTGQQITANNVATTAQAQAAAPSVNPNIASQNTFNQALYGNGALSLGNLSAAYSDQYSSAQIAAMNIAQSNIDLSNQQYQNTLQYADIHGQAYTNLYQQQVNLNAGAGALSEAKINENARDALVQVDSTLNTVKATGAQQLNMMASHMGGLEGALRGQLAAMGIPPDSTAGIALLNDQVTKGALAYQSAAAQYGNTLTQLTEQSTHIQIQAAQDIAGIHQQTLENNFQAASQYQQRMDQLDGMVFDSSQKKAEMQNQTMTNFQNTMVQNEALKNQNIKGLIDTMYSRQQDMIKNTIQIWSQNENASGLASRYDPATNTITPILDPATGQQMMTLAGRKDISDIQIAQAEAHAPDSQLSTYYGKWVDKLGMPIAGMEGQPVPKGLTGNNVIDATGKVWGIDAKGNPVDLGINVGVNGILKKTITGSEVLVNPKTGAPLGGVQGGSVSGTQTGGTLADRNNNPGNLRSSTSDGAQPGQGGFVSFSTPTQGFAAMVNDVGAKINGQSNAAQNLLGHQAQTLQDVISVYAPKGDNNDPAGYAADVAKQLGISPDTPVSQLKGMIPQVAAAMAKHEGYSGNIQVNNDGTFNVTAAGTPQTQQATTSGDATNIQVIDKDSGENLGSLGTYLQSTNGNSPYLDLTSLRYTTAPGVAHLIEQTAREAGVPVLNGAQATQLQSGDEAESNINSMMDNITKLLPLDAAGRPLDVAGQKLSALFKSDKDIASFNAWRPAAISAMKALAVGTRIYKSELANAENALPTLDDPVDVAQQKIKDTEQLIQNVRDEILKPTLGAQQTQQQQSQDAVSSLNLSQWNQ